MEHRLYQILAGLVQARDNCSNTEWFNKHDDMLDSLVKEYLPRGSGFDVGTSLSSDSTPERLIFQTSFHHMNDYGSYDGWTEHRVTVTPSLALGFTLKVSGRDRRDIKDYIAECFEQSLNQTMLPTDTGYESKARRDYRETEHEHVGVGYCPICKHYGEDCTGRKVA